MPAFTEEATDHGGAAAAGVVMAHIGGQARGCIADRGSASVEPWQGVRMGAKS